jgi:hypothetical protein
METHFKVLWACSLRSNIIHIFKADMWNSGPKSCESPTFKKWTVGRLAGTLGLAQPAQIQLSLSSWRQIPC